jgi:predicted enzyme related to lactoylglutathione lyase
VPSVSHFEIPADDVERAKAFYAGAFGFAINTIPDMNYTMVVTGPTGEDGRPTEPGHINGGMFAREGDFASLRGPIITIVVDDVEAALADVKAHGGEQFGETFEVGGMGVAGYFTDSEGNVLGLWQSAM